jgi:hypothetical protein
MTDIDPRILARVDALRARYSRHDGKAEIMRCVREGRWDDVAPDIFSAEWPGPTVSNLIDIQVRAFVAAASAVPSVNCSSTSMVSEAARDRADTRTKIANHYLTTSNFKALQPLAVDNYATYGLYAWQVVPDQDAQLPRIRVKDSQNVWPLWDNDMNTVAVARSYWVPTVNLQANYPDALAGKVGSMTPALQEVIEYEDNKSCVTYVKSMSNLFLEAYDNPLKMCSWVCVPRYSGGQVFDGNFRGAYDDLVWPQLLRHEFQMLAMSAADQAINAPIVVGTDVADVPMGPGAIVRTNGGANSIARVRLDVPQQAFQSMEWLREDMIQGGMTTEGNLGSAGSGWTTGRGQEQLGAGYDAQVALAQVQFGFGLQQILQKCFKTDESYWGNDAKKIRGMEQGGAPYQFTYTPTKDIDGDHTVDIRYGFLSGMDDNRALVFILQAQAAGLVSKDFGRRHLPEGVDAAQEEKKIRLEQLQESLALAMSSLPQAIPQMITNGMDATDLVAKYAGVISDLEHGDTIQDSVLKRFAPQPAPAPLAPAGQPSPAGGSELAGAGAEPPGPGAQFNQGGPGGGSPPLAMLIAGLTGRGNPNLAASVSRQAGVVQ